MTGTHGAGRPAGDRPRIAFFGSGAFATPILEALAAMADVTIPAVVSVPDRPAGRSARPTPPPVVERARALGLAVLQPPRLRDQGALDALAALELDAAVLADYGRLVPPAMLAVPRRGFLNVHPSALPRHRGATPIQATIAAGDAAAAVTLFEMDEGLDTGPIVAGVSWPLDGRETAPELEAAAAQRGARLLRDTLGRWLAGERRAVPQGRIGVTLTRPLRREDGRLDPTQPAAALARAVRAMAPWPGTFLDLPDGRVVVLRAEVAADDRADRPGLIVADDDGLALATTDGRLRLLEVKPAGGRAMSGAALRRGRPGIVGQVVAAPPAPTAPPGAAEPASPGPGAALVDGARR